MLVKKYYNFAKNVLFPICRSISGDGTYKTLKIIKKKFSNLKIIKFKSGKKVFDWRVPPEWNISDAYVLDKNKRKIIDFKKSNLHVVGYSQKISTYINKNHLLKKIHSIKQQPSAIPYITSYYKKYWGFCASDETKKIIKKNYNSNDKFKVCIKSNFKNNGNIKLGEYFLKGKSKQEILISTYICHPSMANNELSGPIVAMCLMDYFKKKTLQKSIRFLFIPETIGSISYLSKNLNYLKKNVIAGYNLTCIGDEREYGCMFSKYKNTFSDKALIKAYKELKIRYKEFSFIENGSDERQYNSYGVDLPIASIFRSKYGTYPEYHTSLDNFEFVTLKGIKGGFNVAKKSIEIILKTITPKTKIICEPQMGKRNLYPSISSKNNMHKSKKLMNFLQYSDGKNDLREISKIIKCSYKEAMNIYKTLKQNNLID